MFLYAFLPLTLHRTFGAHFNDRTRSTPNNTLSIHNTHLLHVRCVCLDINCLDTQHMPTTTHTRTSSTHTHINNNIYLNVFRLIHEHTRVSSLIMFRGQQQRAARLT